MKCTVYWADEGLILVPDCMIASREAEHRYGPLVFCGAFDTQGISSELAELIDREMDRRSFVTVGPDLALRLDREAKHVPLPHGFRWHEGGSWQANDELMLLCGRYPPVAVAIIRPACLQGGWQAITNDHKDWPVRGTRISQSRATAVHFVNMWANSHAHTLRAEIVTGFHSKAVNGPAAQRFHWSLDQHSPPFVHRSGLKPA